MKVTRLKEPKLFISQLENYLECYGIKLNDAINDVCRKYDLGGSCKSWFDGSIQWIRRDGVQQWYNSLTDEDYLNLLIDSERERENVS